MIEHGVTAAGDRDELGVDAQRRELGDALAGPLRERAGVGVAVLGILAIPMKDMKTALPGSGMSEKSTSERQAYDLISDAWGKGANGTLLVAVDGAGAQPNQRLGAYKQIVDQLNTNHNIAPLIANAQLAQLAQDNKAATIMVTPKSGPNDDDTKTLVTKLRTMTNGDAGTKARLGVDLGVAGSTAIEMDISEKLGDALWTYLGIVVGLAFLLLLVGVVFGVFFRSFSSFFVPVTSVPIRLPTTVIPEAWGAARALSPAPGAPTKPKPSCRRSSTGGMMAEPKATPITSATCCFHGVAPTS